MAKITKLESLARLFLHLNMEYNEKSTRLNHITKGHRFYDHERKSFAIEYIIGAFRGKYNDGTYANKEWMSDGDISIEYMGNGRKEGLHRVIHDLFDKCPDMTKTLNYIGFVLEDENVFDQPVTKLKNYSKRKRANQIKPFAEIYDSLVQRFDEYAERMSRK